MCFSVRKHKCCHVLVLCADLYFAFYTLSCPHSEVIFHHFTLVAVTALCLNSGGGYGTGFFFFFFFFFETPHPVFHCLGRVFQAQVIIETESCFILLGRGMEWEMLWETQIRGKQFFHFGEWSTKIWDVKHNRNFPVSLCVPFHLCVVWWNWTILKVKIWMWSITNNRNFPDSSLVQFYLCGGDGEKKPLFFPDVDSTNFSLHCLL